jgi:hypothetical protein
MYKESVNDVNESVGLDEAQWDVTDGTWMIGSGSYDDKEEIKVSSAQSKKLTAYFHKTQDGDMWKNLFHGGVKRGKGGAEDQKSFDNMVKSIKESVELDEASKEGTIRIIDLGNRNQDKIRKDLGVDKLGDSGFQVQVMTKGKFVNVGKPYKTMKDAEKVRKSGQHSLPLEMFNNKGAKHAKNEDIDQNRDDTKTTRIAQLNLQIAKAKQTINKLNDKET